MALRPSWYAARAGAKLLREYGTLPYFLDDAISWCWRELAIHVCWFSQLPRGADACCYSTPGTGIRGRVMLSPAAAYPRYVIGHEVGHLLLANGTSFSMACQAWQRLPAEREANNFATAWLMPSEEFASALRYGHTLEQIAHCFAVPEYAVHARLRVARFLSEEQLATIRELRSN